MKKRRANTSFGRIPDGALRKILADDFEKFQKTESRVSQRAFGKRIGLSASEISDIFTGKRTITPNILQKILKSGHGSPALNRVIEKHLRLNQVVETQTQVLAETAENTSLATTWIYFAIQCYLKTPDGGSSRAPAIARAMGLDLDTVISALRTLVENRLVEENADGTYAALDVHTELSWPNSVSAKKGIESALNQQMLHERHNHKLPSANMLTVLTLDKDDIPIVKKMITDFTADILKLSKTGKSEHVYMIFANAIPLTGAPTVKRRPDFPVD